MLNLIIAGQQFCNGTFQIKYRLLKNIKLFQRSYNVQIINVTVSGLLPGACH